MILRHRFCRPSGQVCAFWGRLFTCSFVDSLFDEWTFDSFSFDNNLLFHNRLTALFLFDRFFPYSDSLCDPLLYSKAFRHRFRNQEEEQLCSIWQSLANFQHGRAEILFGDTGNGVFDSSLAWEGSTAFMLWDTEVDFDFRDSTRPMALGDDEAID